MAKGIEIGIGSETKAFKQGVETGIIDPLEDAVDALDELGKSKGPDKLEDGFESAQKASKDLKKEVGETADHIDREFKKSYADMKNSSESGTTKAKADLKELGAEARMNASETFSSFDGSAESFADGIQGTLGGVVSSLGPIGAAAGAAAAIGIGLAMSGIEKTKEESEALKEKIAELTSQYIDSGQAGKRAFSDVLSDIEELATSTDDSVTNLEDLKKIAERLGAPLDGITKSYLEGGSALDDLISQTEDLQKKEQERYEESVANGGSAYDGLISGGMTYENNLKDQLTVLKDQKGAIEEAQEAQLNYLAAGASEFEVKVGLIKSIDQAYDDSAASVDDFIIKETGMLDVTAYIAAMSARTEALKNYQDDLANSGLSDDAKSFLNEQGADAAATFVSGYKAASPAQQAELNRIWGEAGRDNSGEYNKSAQQALDAAAPLKVKPLKVETPNVNGTLNGIQRQLNNRTLTVKVKTVDQYGRDLF
tara:strand:+ start:4352 stop:5800 length:1449 start_codon:yes stop_codon:yes gene_type:complete